jgi:uncharacterized protein (DUF2345 family)
MLDDM